MGFFEDLGQQLSAVWTRLSPGHRVLLLLLVVLCVGALAAAVYWAGVPEYEVLCTGLDAKQCSELVSSLKDEGVKARFADEGSAVMVPAGKIDEARMVAAEQGLPSGARMGFEAFQEPKIGMTPFAERVNYVSALQNELATTISSLDSVVYARVHLALPEKKLFAREQQAASASVMVVTRPEGALRQRYATAMANLVASAVEDLSPEHVTITDGRGNVLGGSAQSPAELAADEQLAYRRQVEQYLSEQAESMLEPVLGVNRCTVRVSAEMDFEDSRETTRKYDPEGRVVVKERVESSQSTGGSTQATGAAGSASNVPGEEGGAASTGPGPTGTSKTEDIETEYLVSESVRESVSRGASIKRLTVAAFVDLTSPEGPAEQEAAEGGEGEGGGGQAAGSLPSVEEVSRMVTEAIGIDESRGDTLKVVEAGFQPGTARLEQVSKALPAWAVESGKYFSIGVAALVLLLIGRRALKRIESASPRRVVVPEVVEGEGGAGPPMAVNEDEIIRREISRFVSESPEMAGRMIEGWVEGEE